MHFRLGVHLLFTTSKAFLNVCVCAFFNNWNILKQTVFLNSKLFYVFNKNMFSNLYTDND